MIYFDQAASSFPKPPVVGEAMIEAINHVGANPGRGSHQLARKAAKLINDARDNIAAFFGCTNPKKVVFFSNATSALNQAIKGFPFQENDHVIATSLEHNSVRRPLEYIKNEKNIVISYIQPNGFGDKDWLNALEEAITSKTKLLIVTHASNVTGELLPLEQMVVLAKEHNIKILVDASQTAGHIDISMNKLGIDLLAFPGHKGLLGPQGTGALLMEGEIHLAPLHHGGTGSHSETIDQPNILPEKYESGTLNTPGIAGLNASLNYIKEIGLEEIVSRETILINHLIEGLSSIDGIKIYGPPMGKDRMAVVSFLLEGVPSTELGMILDEHYQIAVRTGLHCSPLAHEYLKTIETGLVRVSLSYYNTLKEVDSFLEAIREIKAGYMEL